MAKKKAARKQPSPGGKASPPKKPPELPLDQIPTPLLGKNFAATHKFEPFKRSR